MFKKKIDKSTNSFSADNFVSYFTKNSCDELAN